MKVFIITEGGRKIGFGHITRCISLYDAFSEIGASPVFIINGDAAIKGLLKNKKYKIFDWLKEENKVLRLIKGADIVIMDSYMAGLKFYSKVSKSARVAAYIDDYKRLDYPDGVVINGSVYAEGIDYPRKKGVTYLTGIRYALLRKELRDVPGKKIRQKIKTIMVAFGGDDSRNMTPGILRFLNEEYPNLVKNVIIGAGFNEANVKAAEKEKGKGANLIYYPDAEKIKDVMLESDMAICAGGQTLYELARIGVPAVGICIADNQLCNLRGWKKAGFLEYAGWCNDKGVTNQLRKCIKKLNDFKARKKIHNTAVKLIDGKGSSRIAGALCEKLKKNSIDPQNKYIIATIKSWNIERAKKLIDKSPWRRGVLLTHERDLIYGKIRRYNPIYIFFPHWSRRVPGSVYENFECVGFHMTDLPFGRGGTPLQNLIERGIKKTKISAIKLAKDIDAGPVYLKRNLSLAGSAEDIYKRASSIIFDSMIPAILKKRPLPRLQQGRAVIFKRRKPEASEIPSGIDMDGVYDHIRMLDCEGYPPAFIETGNLRFEFKEASKKKKYVYAKVRIGRKA